MRDLKPGDVVHVQGIVCEIQKLHGKSLGIGERHITQSLEIQTEYTEVGNKISMVVMLS